ncbi:TRI59 protein, partial [Formicarius rufipectus]|nr:TRI59 protein [Formicarius rufipectus]
MEGLEEELTCAVCYGIFEEPRVLPCSHTFCRSCLQGILRSSPGRRSLRCPTCRASTDLPAASLDSLPTNFALKAVIARWQQEEPPGAGTCREHPRQPLNIYCLRDGALVCGHCLTVGRHRGHPIDDLQSAHGRAREAAGKLQEQLTERLWKEVFLCHLKLTMQKSRCEKLLRSERDVVVRYFEELAETLECKKQALLGALDELNRRFLEQHEPLVREMSKMKVEEIELKCLNSSIRREKSPLLCLEKLEELQQRVKALQEKELPDVRPLEIHPRMDDLLKNVWSSTEIGQIHTILPPKLQLIPRKKLSSKCPGKENRESTEQLRAVKLHLEQLRALRQLRAPRLPLVLLLVLGVLGTAFSLLRAVPGGAIPAAPGCLVELLLQACQGCCPHVRGAVCALCRLVPALSRLCSGVVPF